MAVGQSAAGGAIKDPDASQTNNAVTQANGGATVVGIGFSTTVVKDDDPTLPFGSPWSIDDGTILNYNRIGGAHDTDVTYAATDVATNSGTRVRKAPADLADGGTEGGWFNRTGQTVLQGQWYIQTDS